MFLYEANTRAKLIDPTIHRCGWTENLNRLEGTAGTIEIPKNYPHRKPRGRVDYFLRMKVTLEAQPVAIAYLLNSVSYYPIGPTAKKNWPDSHKEIEANG